MLRSSEYSYVLNFLFFQRDCFPSSSYPILSHNFKKWLKRLISLTAMQTLAQLLILGTFAWQVPGRLDEEKNYTGCLYFWNMNSYQLHPQTWRVLKDVIEVLEFSVCGRIKIGWRTIEMCLWVVGTGDGETLFRYRGWWSRDFLIIFSGYPEKLEEDSEGVLKCSRLRIGVSAHRKVG